MRCCAGCTGSAEGGVPCGLRAGAGGSDRTVETRRYPVEEAWARQPEMGGEVCSWSDGGVLAGGYDINQKERRGGGGDNKSSELVGRM